MLRSYDTKPSNKIVNSKINGRCCYKKFGKKCSERGYGSVNSQTFCKHHYLEAMRFEEKYSSTDKEKESI